MNFLKAFFTAIEYHKARKDIDDYQWKYMRKTNKVITDKQSNIQWIVSKFWWTPYWPKWIERPKCEKWHNLHFILQILSDDIPSFEKWHLISFHYCDECAREWNMSWGHKDEKRDKYDVRIFRNIKDYKPDNINFEFNYSPIEEMSIELQSFEDMPCDQIEFDYDLWKENSIRSLAWMHQTNTVEGSKFWWWPFWMQNEEYPKDKSLKFIWQINMMDWKNTAWATGAAYLFVDFKNWKWELVIQTT